MSKFDTMTVLDWKTKAERYLIDNHGITLQGVKTGVDAWEIAHRCGITLAAYKDCTVVDAHIVTALKQIFPSAIFKDKYSY
jgi:hypothetical protein